MPFPRYPELLKRLATLKKNKGLSNELRRVLSGSVSGDTESLLSDYIPVFFKLIVDALKSASAECVAQMLNEYRLTPEMVKEHLIQLQFGSVTAAVEWKEVPKSVKTALSAQFYKRFKCSVERIKKRPKGQFGADLCEEPVFEEREESESELKAKAIVKRRKRSNKPL